MPELEWRYGYAWALGLMLASALGLIGYFKKRAGGDAHRDRRRGRRRRLLRAKLARAGESVVVLARGAHLEAIRRDGLRVRSAVDGEFTAKVDAVASFAASRPWTWRSSA